VNTNRPSIISVTRMGTIFAARTSGGLNRHAPLACPGPLPVRRLPRFIFRFRLRPLPLLR